MHLANVMEITIVFLLGSSSCYLKSLMANLGGTKNEEAKKLERNIEFLSWIAYNAVFLNV